MELSSETNHVAELENKGQSRILYIWKRVEGAHMKYLINLKTIYIYIYRT